MSIFCTPGETVKAVNRAREALAPLGAGVKALIANKKLAESDLLVKRTRSLQSAFLSLPLTMMSTAPISCSTASEANRITREANRIDAALRERGIIATDLVADDLAKVAEAAEESFGDVVRQIGLYLLALALVVGAGAVVAGLVWRRR